ncbi:Uncharacterized protein dnm_033120 [Desulfonema magnum]|uniref:Uncharacterized protein n=2 Tax=Desulfonema magnum TaxID=45655 RepID=A0A975GN18_9BACT|nr:Uncharacterized protein dnm_033120 [Desulfonema magnum]
MKFYEIQRRKAVKRIWVPTLVFFCVLLFWVTAAVFAGANKTTIYFYSSESNINNFKSLKIEFDSYLSSFGNYELGAALLGRVENSIIYK